MQRDSQRNAVYQWEESLWKEFGLRPRDPMSLKDCQHLINKIWKKHEKTLASPPIVKDGRARRRACYERHSIKLPRWSRFPAVVLHETAHGLLRDHKNLPAHGPVFARLLFDLMCHEFKLCRSTVRRMANHQTPRKVRLALRRDLQKYIRTN